MAKRKCVLAESDHDLSTKCVQISSDLAGRGWGFSGREVSLSLQISLWSNPARLWRVPRTSALSKKKKKRLLLGVGGLIKVKIHLGLKSYIDDQKQLTEVVICRVKGEEQQVAASKLCLAVHVK